MKNIELLDEVMDYLNKEVIFTNSKKEALDQLKRISLLFKEINFIPDYEFFNELLTTNKTIKRLLRVVVGSKAKITRSNIENITADATIQLMIEVYCTLFNIEIIEDKLDDITSELKNLVFISGQDSMTTYLQEITLPLLTREEEKYLFERVTEGNQLARQKLIERNLKLVVYVARRYRNNGISLEDLVSEGNIGLITALEHFDLSKGTKFSTYAVPWIKQSITRYIENNKHEIRIPCHTQWKLAKYHKGLINLTNQLRRTPSLKELSKYLKMSEEEITELESYKKRTISLSTIIHNDDNEDKGSELELFISLTTESVEEQGLASFLTEDVAKLLEKCGLSEREKLVLILRYGLNGKEIHTLEKIGQILKLTRERVRQIENAALQKIRLISKTEALAEYLDNPDACLDRLSYLRSFGKNHKSTEQLLKGYEEKRKTLTKKKR